MEVGGVLLVLLFSSACAELKMSAVSPVTATLGSDALLECTFIVDKFPVDLKYLAIVWSFSGKELLRFANGLKVLEPRASINETVIQNGDASLLMSNVTVHDEGMYECSVIYTPTKRKEFVTLNPQARPQIFIPQREAIIGKEALLRCCVLGFYPVEIDIAWLRDGQILPGTSTSKPQQYANGTFRINSTVTLLPADSDAHLNFSCRVQHASLPGPLQEDIQLLLEEEEKGASVAALVVPMLVILVFIAVGLLLFRKYAKEKEKLTMSEITGPRVWTLGEPVQLVCVGFHCPKGIEIKWTKLHEGLETMINPNPMTDCQDTEPLLGEEGHKAVIFKVRESRGYVTISSAVIVKPTMGEDEGAVFKCRFFTKDSQKINEEKEFKDFKIQGKPQAMEIKCVSHDGNNLQCCLELLRFYPKGIQLKWSSGTGSLEDVPSEEHEMGEAAGFSIRSTCVINEDAFTDPNFKIRVTWEHSSLDDPEYKEISVTDPAFPGRPDLQDILVPKLIHGKEVSLQGQVSGYFPKELKVEWLRVERGIDAQLTSQGDAESTVWKQDITDYRREPEIGHSCTARLTFTPDLHRDWESEIICRMSHPSLQRALEKTTGMLTVLGKPQATEIKCVPRDRNNVQCCLELLRFYPKGIQLKWSSGTGSLKYVPSQEHEMGDAAGFSIRSTCVINEDAFTDPNFKIRVTWEHSSLDDPEYKEISVTDPAFPGRPDLQDILVPKLIHGKEVSLQGQVSGYFPKELKVEWLRMERGSDARVTTQGDAESTVWKQDITDCRREPEIGHSCTAQLTFTPDLHRDWLSEIICRVSHPSLQRPLEKTTGMLTVLGVPKVNPWEIMTMTLTSDATTLSLEVDNFSPGGKDIQWFCEPIGELPSKLHMTHKQDGTHTAKSICEPHRSMRKKITEHGKITVIIEHEALDKALKVSARYKGKGRGWELLKGADKQERKKKLGLAPGNIHAAFNDI